MQNGFNILFSYNGNYLNSMYVTEDMNFSAVVANLYKFYPLISQCQPTFYIYSNEVKANSTQTMKDLKMQNMSYVEIRVPMNYQIPMGGEGLFEIKFYIYNLNFFGDYSKDGFLGIQ